VDGGGYDPFAADVWAFGAMLFRLFTGACPFGSPEDNIYLVAQQARTEAALAFPAWLEEEEPAAVELIRRCLSPAASARPTAAAIAESGWLRDGGGWGWDRVRRQDRHDKAAPSPLLVPRSYVAAHLEELLAGLAEVDSLRPEGMLAHVREPGDSADARDEQALMMEFLGNPIA
jgi:serine/threonine protein kinase